MKDLENSLKKLGEVARQQPALNVDVRQTVLQTIAGQTPTAKYDTIPLVLGGLAITVAAMIFVAFSSSWETMFDPWASYFAQVSRR